MKRDRARQVAQELQLLSSRDMGVVFHGASMLPVLRDGDRVLVEPVEWDDIMPGDVVTYRADGRFPTRRVVGKADDTLLLWCDNWPHDRFRAPRDSVLGRAIARERGGVWLPCSDAEWTAATRRGLARYRWLEVRRALGGVRDGVRRLIRSGGRGRRPA